ncbi:Uu.00g049560.m01.CDS01 [Anthostomella pinea]|uniref:Uu.00g049560.m01.CDS01 n=1 Tax=Anthostomella pinea TaxID=933095 RepID=A0AAI8V6W6_9PEZI|nr:Uu.00g049560.m01.CDS01 [Anthostomella pinea]
MRTSLFLGLAGTAPTAPLNSGQVASCYPASSSSTGFHLVANVTEPSTDLTPSPKRAESHGMIFYQNGTAEEIRDGRGSIITDGGTPAFPFGIYIQAEDRFDTAYPAEHAMTIQLGSGTTRVSLATLPSPYSYLTGGAQGLFVACPRTIAYYGAEFVVVRFAYDTVDSDPTLNANEHNVPEGCTAINLLPECDTLPELFGGGVSSHEFAATSRCYEDVAAIDWSDCGP